jgi:hypothetical protein
MKLLFIVTAMLVAYGGIVAAPKDDKRIFVQQKNKIDPRVWGKANAEGSVHVVVELNTPWQRTGKLSKEQEVAQQKTIADAQNQLIAELAGTRHKVERRLENQPLIGLEVGTDALTILDASPLVLHVSEHYMNSPA